MYPRFKKAYGSQEAYGVKLLPSKGVGVTLQVSRKKGNPKLGRTDDLKTFSTIWLAALRSEVSFGSHKR